MYFDLVLVGCAILDANRDMPSAAERPPAAADCR